MCHTSISNILIVHIYTYMCIPSYRILSGLVLWMILPCIKIVFAQVLKTHYLYETFNKIKN